MLTQLYFDRRGKIFHFRPLPQEPEPMVVAIREALIREGYLALFKNTVKLLQK